MEGLNFLNDDVVDRAVPLNVAKILDDERQEERWDFREGEMGDGEL